MSRPVAEPRGVTGVPNGAIVFGVMLGLFLGAMESTAVATAMPTVIASLGGLAIYSWVFSGYILAATISMPLWGKAADLYGRRAAYLTGLGIFLLGSILSGLAESMAALIAFRTLQGLGGGALIPLGYTIVGDLYGLERRAKMQGYFSATWGIASIVGPLIGGLLTDRLSWRWVFYVNVPFGILAGVVLGWALARFPRPAGPVRMDVRGAALLTVGMTALLVALVEGGRGGTGFGPTHWILLAVAAVALGVFVAWERRAPEPLLPLHLFTNRMFRAAAISGLLAGMAMFGTISFIPLFVQGVLGGTATQAGTALTPFVLGWVVLSVVSARLLLRVGYRPPVLAGMVCLAIAFLLMSHMGLGTSRSATGRNMLLAGMGMGLIMVPLLIAVQNAVPRRDLGAATSATTFFRSIGGAVGVAVMGAVLSHELASQLRTLGGAAGVAAGQLQALVAHPDAVVHPATRLTLPPAILAAFSQALANALHAVFLVGFAIACLALASAFLVPAGRAQDLALNENRVPGSSS
jgi:EmrB/QacA subfamily drug resistance transporter